MRFRSETVVVDCDGNQLAGIFEIPESAREAGVVMVTGGPQYRIGSHRQNVIIARALAEEGFASLRIDYRGMGDSVGEAVIFDSCSDDIAAAIDSFEERTGIRNIMLWGLCDAASACMIYAGTDDRVQSMVLLNPWVRSDSGRAKAFVKHYYLIRFFSADFWRKVFSGKFNVGQSILSLKNNLVEAFFPHPGSNATKRDSASTDFRDRMLDGMNRFDGRVLLLLCGDDLTAAEFSDYTKESWSWKRVLERPNLIRKSLPGVDHTFSSAPWRQQVIDESVAWAGGKSCD